MQYKKLNAFRFFLTQEECGRDDVEITVEYRVDQSDPKRGNCFVDYWLNLRDYGFRSHLGGIWLHADKDTLLPKIKLHMLRGIKDQIRLYEQEINWMEQAREAEEDTAFHEEMTEE